MKVEADGDFQTDSPRDQNPQPVGIVKPLLLPKRLCMATVHPLSTVAVVTFLLSLKIHHPFPAEQLQVFYSGID